MGLDIEAKIPEKETGTLVAALTDMIRPFTEGRGLKADQIRLQREDVLLEIAKKARKRAEAEKAELHSVPTKLMVPFLEKASLEDIDIEMQERWAALLVSASKNYESLYLTFVDILSRLSSEELQILEAVCFDFEKFPSMHYPGGHFEDNQNRITSNASKLTIDDANDDKNNNTNIPPHSRDTYKAYESFMESVRGLQYAKIIHAVVTYKKCSYYFYSEFLDKKISLDILQRERLIEIKTLKFPSGAEVGYFDITRIGVNFVKNCSSRHIEKR